MKAAFLQHKNPKRMTIGYIGLLYWFLFWVNFVVYIGSRNCILLVKSDPATGAVDKNNFL